MQDKKKASGKDLCPMCDVHTRKRAQKHVPGHFAASGTAGQFGISWLLPFLAQFPCSMLYTMLRRFPSLLNDFDLSSMEAEEKPKKAASQNNFHPKTKQHKMQKDINNKPENIGKTDQPQTSHRHSQHAGDSFRIGRGRRRSLSDINCYNQSLWGRSQQDEPPAVTTPLKLHYKGDTRRLKMKFQTISEAVRLVKSCFGRLPGQFSLLYEDDEGDMVVVALDQELRDAFELAELENKVLKLYICLKGEPYDRKKRDAQGTKREGQGAKREGQGGASSQEHSNSSNSSTHSSRTNSSNGRSSHTHSSGASNSVNSSSGSTHSRWSHIHSSSFETSASSGDGAEVKRGQRMLQRKQWREKRVDEAMIKQHAQIAEVGQSAPPPSPVGSEEGDSSPTSWVRLETAPRGPTPTDTRVLLPVPWIALLSLSLMYYCFCPTRRPLLQCTSLVVDHNVRKRMTRPHGVACPVAAPADLPAAFTCHLDQCRSYLALSSPSLHLQPPVLQRTFLHLSPLILRCRGMTYISLDPKQRV
eukprot:g75181.t1